MWLKLVKYPSLADKPNLPANSVHICFGSDRKEIFYQLPGRREMAWARTVK